MFESVFFLLDYHFILFYSFLTILLSSSSLSLSLSLSLHQHRSLRFLFAAPKDVKIFISALAKTPII